MLFEMSLAGEERDREAQFVVRSIKRAVENIGTSDLSRYL